MFSLITKYSTFAGIFKLIFLVIIFIVILVLSYLVTKWYANSSLVKNKTNNIEIKELILNREVEISDSSFKDVFSNIVKSRKKDTKSDKKL